MTGKQKIEELTEALRYIQGAASSIRINGFEEHETLDDVMNEIEDKAIEALSRCNLKIFE